MFLLICPVLSWILETSAEALVSLRGKINKFKSFLKLYLKVLHVGTVKALVSEHPWESVTGAGCLGEMFP